MSSSRLALVATTCAVAAAGVHGPLAAEASPLPLGRAAAQATCDAVWRDTVRRRDIPVRVRMPSGTGAVPLVLFSHGLGGSVAAGTTWGEHWARHGIAVIHIQHPGSDEGVWKDVPAARRQASMRDAMSAEQLVARTEDVRFVLDAATTRAAVGACDLRRIDRSRIGMSGHSYGAHTTQAVAGQGFPAGRTMREPRIRAAIAFSPAPPNRPGADVLRSAFGGIGIPFFSITGTRDEVPTLTPTTPSQRTLPYAHMPPGDKYLLVFEGADHAAFGGQSRPLRGGGGTPATVEDDVKAATLAFWRSTLLGDTTARRWLSGGGLRSALAPRDRFEHK
jgi:predicted dienelactone hydrolase